MVGDTIPAVDTRPNQTAAELLAATHATPPNSTIDAVYLRGSVTSTVGVTLESVNAG